MRSWELCVCKRKHDNAWFIENYVMSCRALGKTVEIEALKAILLGLDKKYLANTIEAVIIKTALNRPTYDLFNQLSFIRANNEPDRWQLSSTKDIKIESYIRLIDEIFI